MNNCPDCNAELVNVVYGVPTPRLTAIARKEGIALGGTQIKDRPKFYCYGCHETFGGNA